MGAGLRGGQCPGWFIAGTHLDESKHHGGLPGGGSPQTACREWRRLARAGETKQSSLESVWESRVWALGAREPEKLTGDAREVWSGAGPSGSPAPAG